MVQWLRALALAGPGFDSQHLYDASQPPVAPVPGDLMPSSEPTLGTRHTCCTDVHAGQNTHGFLYHGGSRDSSQVGRLGGSFTGLFS